MSKKLRRLRGVIALGIPLAFVAGLVGLTYFHVRQEQLDRALITAIVRNDTPTALRLLDAGADPNAQLNSNEVPVGWRGWLRQMLGRTYSQSAPAALELAMVDADDPFADHGPDYTIAIALLQHGADPNRCAPDGQTWPEGWTPLMEATQNPNVRHRLIASLLAHGAKVNARDTHGGTALRWTVWNADKLGADMLVNAGADVNAKGDKGQTILAHTCLNRPEMVPFLLAHGADVNAADVDGYTVLMEAAGRGNIKLVRLLLAAGANVHANGKGGWTALRAARQATPPQWIRMPMSMLPIPPDDRSLRAVITLLRKAGARE